MKQSYVLNVPIEGLANDCIMLPSYVQRTNLASVIIVSSMRLGDSLSRILMTRDLLEQNLVTRQRLGTAT